MDGIMQRRLNSRLVQSVDHLAWSILKRVAYIIKKMQKKRCYRILFFRWITLTIMSIAAVIFMTLVFMPSQANANESTEDVTYKYYQSVEIEPGDSLWEYAKEFSQEQSYASYIEEVMEINHLSSDRLVAGETIILPYYSNDYIYQQ